MFKTEKLKNLKFFFKNVLSIRLLHSLGILVGVLNYSYSFAQNSSDEIYEVVNDLVQSIDSTQYYDRIKLDKIESLKKNLLPRDSSIVRNRFSSTYAIFEEYQVFKQDSAFKYAQNLKRLALRLQADELLTVANLKLAEVNIAAGMYKEGIEFLKFIPVHNASVQNRASYFSLLGRAYNEMSTYSNLSFYTQQYQNKAIHFRKEAYALSDLNSFEKKFLEGIIAFDEGRFEVSNEILKKLANRKLNHRQVALVNSVLGFIQEKVANIPDAITYFSKAAMADIRSSTKETSATTALARILFKEGFTKTASLLIQKANADALFYGAQQRKIEVGSILPIIEQQVVDQIEAQKTKLYTYNLLMIALTVFLISLAIIILIQLNRIKQSRAIIHQAQSHLENTNRTLKQVNEEVATKNVALNDLTQELLEANKIKDEYIGLFVTQDVIIFQKFKEFKAKVVSNLSDNNIAKLKHTVENLDLKKEKERLLQNFDKAFIQLFPTFVVVFNSLLKENEQIVLKKEQTLTKELRIFALMRLGITQNEIIAQILDFNVNSVYTYKTRIRKKSLFKSTEFDKQLYKNTTLKV